MFFPFQIFLTRSQSLLEFTDNTEKNIGFIFFAKRKK